MCITVDIYSDSKYDVNCMCEEEVFNCVTSYRNEV